MTASLELRIESLAAGGDGVGRDDAGRVVFVPLTAPGDRVRVRVVESRKRFARGELEEVLEPGPDRADPACAWFGRCGGCAWQHVSYEAQLRAKSAIVSDALERIGRFELAKGVPVTPSPSEWGYRVRARLVQDASSGRLGYRMRRSHRVCAVDACPILDPGLEVVLARPPGSARGLRADSRRAEPSDDPAEWEAAVGSDGRVRLDRTSGRAAPVDRVVAGDLLRVSHGVFAQANGLLVEALAGAVVREAAHEGSAVSCVELYAGGGLFTLGLSRRFDEVWAVEAHPGAIADLRLNLSRAQRSNVRVREGPVEQVLPSLGIASPDALVLDPPRTGVTSDALRAIVALEPQRITYLSCDPATLARDLGRLRDEGYGLTRVEAFDLFPQTPHVEVLAGLRSVRTTG